MFFGIGIIYHVSDTMADVLTLHLWPIMEIPIGKIYILQSKKNKKKKQKTKQTKKQNKTKQNKNKTEQKNNKTKQNKTQQN